MMGTMTPTPATSTNEAPSNMRTTLYFVAAAVTWGASFMFIKITLEGMSPLQTAFGRLATGALALLLIVAAKRQPLPRRITTYGHMAVIGLVMAAAPFVLFAWAETRIDSSLASIYNATTPLMTTIVALAFLKSEKFTTGRIAGLVAGFIGVLLVLGPWKLLDTDAALNDPAGQIACLGATLGYGIGFVYMRRFVIPLGLTATMLALLQVGFGVIWLLPTLPFMMQPMQLTWPIVASLAALGALGTGIAFIWNADVVRAWGPTNASTVTYISPVVGVLLGVAVLSEPLHWNEPVGMLVVFLGVALTQGRIRLPDSSRRPRSSST